MKQQTSYIKCLSRNASFCAQLSSTAPILRYPCLYEFDTLETASHSPSTRRTYVAALSPTRTSSSGTPTATLVTLCLALARPLSKRCADESRGPAMLAPPVGATDADAVVLTLSLRVRLASLSLRSRTIFSSSRIRFFSRSFSLLADSSSPL